MSLRDLFRRKKDVELVQTYMESGYSDGQVEWQYKKAGGISPELAEQNSHDRQVHTTARAVARERLGDGGGNFHQALRSPDLMPSPKEQNRGFGSLLRRNRGSERE